MRYNKTKVTIGNCFPEVWEILPSAFGIGQYFPNVGETFSNSDLNASDYLYIMKLTTVIIIDVNEWKVTLTRQDERLRTKFRCEVDRVASLRTASADWELKIQTHRR